MARRTPTGQPGSGRAILLSRTSSAEAVALRAEIPDAMEAGSARSSVEIGRGERERMRPGKSFSYCAEGSPMTERRGLVLRLLYLGILYARKAVQLGPCEQQQPMDASCPTRCISLCSAGKSGRVDMNGATSTSEPAYRALFKTGRPWILFSLLYLLWRDLTFLLNQERDIYGLISPSTMCINGYYALPWSDTVHTDRTHEGLLHS